MDPSNILKVFLRLEIKTRRYLFSYYVVNKKALILWHIFKPSNTKQEQNRDAYLCRVVFYLLEKRE